MLGAGIALFVIAQLVVWPLTVAISSFGGIRQARMDGLATFFGNPASPHAERHLDLTGIGRLLAVSIHRERNLLACVH